MNRRPNLELQEDEVWSNRSRSVYAQRAEIDVAKLIYEEEYGFKLLQTTHEDLTEANLKAELILYKKGKKLEEQLVTRGQELPVPIRDTTVEKWHQQQRPSLRHNQH